MSRTAAYLIVVLFDTYQEMNVLETGGPQNSLGTTVHKVLVASLPSHL